MAARSNLAHLAVLCLTLTTFPCPSVLATAIYSAETVGLVARQESTCALDPSLLQCGGGLPSEFCCPRSTQCLSLDNGSSIICCPAGQDCKLIQPITCDISQQNAKEHPRHAIHSIELSKELPKCGSACCPMGYVCRNGQCAIIGQDSSIAPFQSASATSSTSISSPTSAESSTLPTASGPGSGNSAYPARAVVAGFFPGLILGILLTVGAMLLIRRYGWGQTTPSPSTITSLGPPAFSGRSVSEPISHPHFGNRTDFLLRPNTNSSGGSKNSSLKDESHVGNNHPNHNTPAAASAFSFPFSSGSPARPGRPPSSAPSASVYPATPTPAPLAIRTTRLSNRLPRPPLPIRALFTRSPSPSGARQTRHHSSSSETIEVLMPSQAGLLPPPTMMDSERRNTGNTTFSALMEGAGLGRTAPYRPGVGGNRG